MADPTQPGTKNFDLGPSLIFTLSFKNNIIGLGKKYPSQRRVSLLFTAGEKYAWVGSGQIRVYIYKSSSKKT